MADGRSVGSVDRLHLNFFNPKETEKTYGQFYSDAELCHLGTSPDRHGGGGEEPMETEVGETEMEKADRESREMEEMMKELSEEEWRESEWEASGNQGVVPGWFTREYCLQSAWIRSGGKGKAPEGYLMPEGPKVYEAPKAALEDDDEL